MRRSCCCAACVVLSMTSTLAGQTVVVNDNIGIVPWPEVHADYYEFTVQQVAAGDVTCALFYYDGSNLTGDGGCLDEGSDWYLVSSGDPFGFATLAGGRFTPISIAYDYAPSSQTVLVGSNEFYLGVSTTSTNGEGITEPYCDPNEYQCRNVFGWMRLRNAGGQLEMVDNAVAYGSLGIIVGTTDLVPEPSTLTLCALGLVAFGQKTATNIK